MLCIIIILRRWVVLLEASSCPKYEAHQRSKTEEYESLFHCSTHLVHEWSSTSDVIVSGDNIFWHCTVDTLENWIISHEFENLENCNNFLLVSVWCRVNVVESETLSSSQWMKLVGWELSWLSCECFHLFFMMSLRTIVTSTMFLHLTIKARHQNISQSRPETFVQK